MPNIVGVQFQKAGKLEYYAPNDLDVNVDDWVVVESKRGIEIGSVKFPPKDVEDGDVTLPLKEIIRVATEQDIEKYYQNDKEFLGDFEPVSIKMAKDQNLSLNPTKISGACGRLMCCLKYENDFYEEARAQLPDLGDKIVTPEGKGQVIGLNILDISMQVKIDGLEQPLEYKMEELEAFN